MTRGRRNILFLQGNATWFFQRLGRALAQRGHGVRRVNFCGGDRYFWNDERAIDWRKGEAGLDGFLDDLVRRDGVDTMMLFGDCRPIHRIALHVAERHRIEPLVFEEGYLRPHWITLETGGVNGRSRLPADPAWYREKAAVLPEEQAPRPVGSGLRERISYDFRWQFETLFRRSAYPGYRAHRPYPILAEYASWARRLAGLKLRQAEARAEIERLLESGRRFFLFPLQLDSDYQIRVHAPQGGMMAAVERVLADFARHAPADSLLLIKAHPLDNGWIDYRRRIRMAAKAFGIGERVRYIDGGDLDRLFAAACGTVTVNSTVGLSALAAGMPTVCLGRAIYDMPGLTHQGDLADFWQAPRAPDERLFADFTRIVRAACLVNGNFYTARGMACAIRGCLRRLEDKTDILSDAPPRGAGMDDPSADIFVSG